MRFPIFAVGPLKIVRSRTAAIFNIYKYTVKKILKCKPLLVTVISQSNIFPGRNRRIFILKRVTFPGKGNETRGKKKGMWENRRERKERRGGEVRKKKKK